MCLQRTKVFYQNIKQKQFLFERSEMFNWLALIKLKKEKKMCTHEEMVTLLNKVGLHARPAAMFVQTANKFKSNIRVSKEGKEVDAKSILSILSLAVCFNDVVTIKTEGEDAEEALKQLIDLVNTKFGED